MKTKLKMTVLTWLAIYPMITAMLWFFGEYLSHLWLPLRTLILTGVLVPLMTLVMMPLLRWMFQKWLATDSREKQGQTTGTLVKVLKEIRIKH